MLSTSLCLLILATSTTFAAPVAINHIDWFGPIWGQPIHPVPVPSFPSKPILTRTVHATTTKATPTNYLTGVVYHTPTATTSSSPPGGVAYTLLAQPASKVTVRHPFPTPIHGPGPIHFLEPIYRASQNAGEVLK